MLRRNVSHAVVPVIGLSQLAFQRNHRQSLVALESRTDIGAVTATQTVENVYLHTELHTLHSGWSLHVQHSEASALLLLVVQYERTDRSVRTNVSALVTLDTVRLIPNRNESGHATFLVFSGSLRPSTILDALECGNLQ